MASAAARAASAPSARSTSFTSSPTVQCALSRSQKPYLCNRDASFCRPKVLKSSSPARVAPRAWISSAPATGASYGSIDGSDELDASPLDSDDLSLDSSSFDLSSPLKTSSPESSADASASAPKTRTLSASVRWLNASATGTSASPKTSPMKNAREAANDAASRYSSNPRALRYRPGSNTSGNDTHSPSTTCSS